MVACAGPRARHLARLAGLAARARLAVSAGTCGGIAPHLPVGTVIVPEAVLTRDGFIWDAFTSPMSAIHTVLKRLVSQGEALSTIDEDGERRFVWKRRGWEGQLRSQAEEAARIEHLLDGAMTAHEYASLRKRWKSGKSKSEV